MAANLAPVITRPPLLLVARIPGGPHQRRAIGIAGPLEAGQQGLWTTLEIRQSPEVYAQSPWIGPDAMVEDWLPTDFSEGLPDESLPDRQRPLQMLRFLRADVKGSPDQARIDAENLLARWRRVIQFCDYLEVVPLGHSPAIATLQTIGFAHAWQDQTGEIWHTVEVQGREGIRRLRAYTKGRRVSAAETAMGIWNAAGTRGFKMFLVRHLGA
jgi:hypothetical protein